MTAFDRLPRSVRCTLASARYSWPVADMTQRLNEGWTEQEVCRLISGLDADLAAQRRRA